MITKEQFIERFGVDPVDEIGEDWEECVEEYIKNANDEDEYIDRL